MGAKKKDVKKTYEFVLGARVSGGLNAQTVGEELARLTAKYGMLTAEVILREAEPEDAPLHPAFEWDDSKAAREYRLSQARYLARSTREFVIIERGKTIDNGKQMVFVHSKKAYRAVADVEDRATKTQDPSEFYEILENAANRIRSDEAWWKEMQNKLAKCIPNTVEPDSFNMKMKVIRDAFDLINKTVHSFPVEVVSKRARV